jgi:hypothetical protein
LVGLHYSYSPDVCMYLGTTGENRRRILIADLLCIQ